ncbi:MAG TPA: twin transmembrane helix small protein [Woeseiaceae bacterium]|nr:twin transmembrane helix small protein [Woeseiaceae bacterium]
MKLLIAMVFVAVVFSLGSALFHMTSSDHDPARVNRALMWRVGFSVLLIVLLLVSWKFELLE